VRVFDGDPQARVKDRDRDRAIYVVDAALRNGQISQQDRDLRVERVHSTATVGELETLVRDLAGAPATPPPTAVLPPPITTPPASMSTPVPADLYGPPPSANRSVTSSVGNRGSVRSGRKLVSGCALLLAVFIGLPIASAVVLFTIDPGSREIVTTEPVPVGPPFELNRSGLQEYVAAFETNFDSTEAVRTIFYDGFVVAWVPNEDGKVEVWDYQDGAFQQFGDPIEESLDPAPVDLAELKPAKVMSLVRQARRTLNVDGPTSEYVIYDRDIIDNTPEVSVYLSNDDGDSGFLVGDLDGNVTTTQASS
jgi:DUF1707 SHOCT-like domain